MKRTIHLKESELKRIIAESVKRVLRESTRPRKRMERRINEGGHLYHQDDDGTIYTNSKRTYRGVPGSLFIWHGAWNDPEVIWKGQSINANDVEDCYGIHIKMNVKKMVKNQQTKVMRYGLRAKILLQRLMKLCGLHKVAPNSINNIQRIIQRGYPFLMHNVVLSKGCST